MSDPRYFMNDGQISYMDPQCPWMYAAVVISVFVKHNRHADGKYLAEAKNPRAYYNEGYRFDCSYMNLN